MSSSDDLTRFDNSTAALAPQFMVAGTTPGALVTIYADGEFAGSATATNTTTPIALQLGHALGNGPHAFTARQTEPDHSESTDSPVLTVSVDTLAPSAPPAPDLLASSDSGLSSEDDVTNDNTPTLTVAADPFYLVTLDGVPLNTAFSSTVPFTAPRIADGRHSFALRAVDAAGNQSSPSPSLDVVIDTAPPAAFLKGPLVPVQRDAATYSFVVTYRDDRALDGTSVGDNFEIRVTGPKAFVTPAVAVSVDPSGFNAATIDATYRFAAPGGAWDYTDNGLYDFQLQFQAVRDVAGNAPSAGQSESIGNMNAALLTPPVAPHLTPASDSGGVIGDDVTNFNNGSPSSALRFLVGGVRTGAAVAIYLNGSLVGNAVASDREVVVAVESARTLADGTYRVTARQTVAGQPPSDESAESLLVIDTIAPATPTSIDLIAASDSGVSDADNLTNDTTPTFRVALPPDAPNVRVFRDGALVSMPYADGPLVTAVEAAPDGPHAYAAAAVDLAGNASGPSAPEFIRIDTKPPDPAKVAGTLDRTFEAGGVKSIGTGPDGMAIQPDGRVLMGYKLADNHIALGRMNPDGSGDASFGTGGQVTLPLLSGGNTAIRLYADGRVLVIGGNRIVRLSAAGVLDTSFGVNGVATIQLPSFAVAAVPDGSVAVVGGSTDYNSDRIGVLRLTPDGSRDLAFSGDGSVDTAVGRGFGSAFGVEVLADGRVLVTGTGAVSGPEERRALLIRYLPDGSLDPDFGQGGIVLTRVMDRANAFSMAVQPDGKILVGGNASRGDPNWQTHGFVLRYTGGGQLDPTFGSGGVFTVPGFHVGRVSLALTPGGEILIAGGDRDMQLDLCRLSADGKLDATFGTRGTGRAQVGAEQGALVIDAAVVPGDKVVVAGMAFGARGLPQSFVTRFDTVTAGTVDLRAASDSGASATDNITNDNTPTFDVVPRAADGGAGPAYYRLYRNQVLVSGGYETSDSVTLSPQPDGTWIYAPAMVDAAGNESARWPELEVTIDTVGPAVSEVMVSSSRWSNAFRAGLEAANLGIGGYLISGSAADPKPLPWSNLDTVTVRMSEGATLRPFDLQVFGLDASPLGVVSFTYNPSTRLAMWRLAQPERAARFLVRLSGAVVDAAGNGLNEHPGVVTGDTDGADRAAPAPFEVGFNVLQGDGDRSARVTALDLMQVRARLSTSTSRPGTGARGYSPFYDVNGDGQIQAMDLAAVRSAMFSRLPPPSTTVASIPARLFGALPIRDKETIDESDGLLR